MLARKTFESENESIKSFVKDSVGVIKLLSNPFDKISNVSWNDRIIELIKYAEKDKSIHSLLILPDKNIFLEKYYDKFLDNIFESQFDDNNLPKAKNASIKDERIRQINLLDRFIINLAKFSKISVFALQDEVVTPFIGLSLAADYRIACPHTKLMFSHVKHGVHPSGALPYYLNKYLSPTFCTKFLFEGGELDAKTAMDYSLIQAILPDEHFNDESLLYASELKNINLNVVRATKALLEDSEKLRKYFEKESSLFFS